MHVDLSELSPNATYAMMTQTIVPRPIAWVLSDNGDGSLNLAPFSYFNAVASDPPTIVLSIGLKPDGAEKDTRVNIETRRHFTVHIAHRELAGSLTRTSAILPHGDSELDRESLRLAEMPGSAVPRLAACRIAYAAELASVTPVGNQALFLATLTHLYLDDALIGRDAKGRPRVLAEKLDPIGRLGGSEYMTFGTVLSIPRPS